MTDDKFNEAMESAEDLEDAAILNYAARIKLQRACDDHVEECLDAHLDAELDLYIAAHEYIDACDAAGIYTLISDEEGHDVFRRIMNEPEKP